LILLIHFPSRTHKPYSMCPMISCLPWSVWIMLMCFWEPHQISKA
jgi:hypothetical protein